MVIIAVVLSAQVLFAGVLLLYARARVLFTLVIAFQAVAKEPKAVEVGFKAIRRVYFSVDGFP